MENNLRKLDFAPSAEQMRQLSKATSSFLKNLKSNIKKQGIDAQVFLGGSFAKETLVMKDSYDIDVFIRIDRKNFEKDISKLQKAVMKTAPNNILIVHGSRDYYQIHDKDNRAVFEIIPVLKIRKPEEAENVTDLSYFHVDYMKRKLSKKMRREVRLAKAFFDACGAYGAESYIQGFSGYATECLIAAFGTLQKMLKGLTKEGKMIVDPAKHYRNPKETLIELNEAKLQSPVIVIDPTWKKRNALASLSQETYEKFKKHALLFLNNPSVKHFEKKEISKEQMQEKAKRMNAEFAEVKIETDRQEGDIAGTKLKKASRFISKECSKAFKISQEEFKYDGEQSASLYLSAKPIKEMTFAGPPLKMKKHAEAFKREHPNAFEKKGRLYVTVKNELSLKQFLESKILNGKELKSMGMTGARVD